MIIPAEFDEIRPYTPEELPEVFNELLADPSFQSVVAEIMPGIPLEVLGAQLRQCKTNLDVQKTFFHKLLHGIMDKYSDGFDMDTASLPDKTRNYTFISNHRDIVLDPGFLSVGLIDNQFPTTVEIAIGDNLLIYPWIKKLVRINKCFTVQRALTMRQMLESSIRMSRYMHYTIAEKKQSIWIAQREGRAKDSNDVTQDSVLKMLAMGGDGDIITNLQELNIVPLSISYEYDPCDYLKAQEFQLKRDIPDYKKTTDDDLLNMQTGLLGYKGRVCFRMASCINEDLGELERTLPKPELFVAISALIDKRIHANYRIFATNYVAHDLLYKEERFVEHYTAEDKKRFISYIDGQLERITLPNKDVDFLREKLLLMYANPLTNYLAATK